MPAGGFEAHVIKVTYVCLFVTELLSQACLWSTAILQTRKRLTADVLSDHLGSAHVPTYTQHDAEAIGATAAVLYRLGDHGSHHDRVPGPGTVR